LVSDEWISRFPQENAGPLHIHDVLRSADIPEKDDIALNVPRYSDGFLYPNDGPGLGIELNDDLVRRLVTPGKQSCSVEA
jgi:L-alanine-DL-glutamate epimerase-like enolase superfamily enzyme